MSSSSTRVCWRGLAAMLGGILYLALNVIYFVFTHGSGQSPRNGTLFGLDSTDYCRMEPIWPVLLMLGLTAFYERQAERIGRWGRWGFIAALIALATVALSWVLQCWVVNPDLYFNSLPVTGGFYLGGLANLCLLISMIVYGIATVRAGARPLWRVLPLAIGLLGVGSVLIEGLVLWKLYAYPLPGDLYYTTRDLAYTANRAPWGLGWVLLGYTLWKSKV
jgi:hypothetical protein